MYVYIPRSSMWKKSQKFILGFHVTSEKKLKLKILSFNFHQLKVIFKHVSADLSSAR